MNLRLDIIFGFFVLSHVPFLEASGGGTGNSIIIIIIIINTFIQFRKRITFV